MKDIIKVFRDIEQMKGKGSQKVIAEHLQDNWSTALESVITVALNQFKPTHIGKLTDTRKFINPELLNYTNFNNLMHECFAVKACTNELRDKVSIFVNEFTDPEDRRILTMIVTKSLNIGLGRALVNKAMRKTLGRDVLPTPEAHLANKDLTLLEKWTCDNVRVNVKYDGYRLIARHEDGKGWTLFTRNFNEFDKVAMNNILDQLSMLFAETILEVGNFFVDGELIAKDSIVAGENSSAARQSVSSIANKILKGGGEKDMDKALSYVIFDIELNEVLDKGKGFILYSMRREVLLQHFDVDIETPNVQMAVEWIVPYHNCMVEINKIYTELIAQGEEGVIIKDPTSVYECGRKKSWLKMKEILSADLKVVACIEGTGKNVGKLGAITVEFSTGETVNVGSGFSDAQREDFWNNQSRLIGSIVEVEYNAKCQDKHGKKSLFIPVFKGVRNDKDIAEEY